MKKGLLLFLVLLLSNVIPCSAFHADRGVHGFYSGNFKVERPVASAADFDPDTIAGLQFWIKADSESYVNDDPVGTATDRSGESHDATQGTVGLKPLFKTGIQNGKPSYQFDGSDDFLSVTDAAALRAGTSDFTFFLAFKTANANQFGALISKLVSADDSRDWLIRLEDGAGGSGKKFRMFKLSANNANNQQAYITDDVIDGNAHYLTWTAQANTTNASWVSKKDGAAASRTSTSNTTDAEALSSTNAINIGRNTNSTAYFTGDILEVLYYVGTLTDTDRSNVEAYLAAKYAL